MSALLEVRDARVTFGGLHAVDGVSLDVAAGSIVGLIGPNGAGKTTLFNGISGLQRLDGGTVSFAGEDVTALAAHERARRGIGRSFQHLGLMTDETVETNLLAAQHLSAGYSAASLVVTPWRWWRREQALRAAAVRAIDAFDLGDVKDTAVADLSFAAARFTELAAVVAERPALMLLDEPTTGLDVAEVDRLTEVLARLRTEGTTIVVIAHDVHFVMDLCDHVYVLAQGRLLAQGAPEEVRTDPAVVEAYLGVPARA